MWYERDQIDPTLTPPDFLRQHGELIAIFDERTQDSGNISYGVEVDGRRYFVKSAGLPDNQRPIPHAMRVQHVYNAVAVRQATPSTLLPTLHRLIDSSWGPLLVYDWAAGELLRRREDPAAPFYRFCALPSGQIIEALDQLLQLHVDLGQAGWVASDFYDGCLLYAFDRRQLTVVDLDHYHQGPFRNEMGRLFGSSRFMAPEEFERGALIDQRTTVFNLGRALFIFLLDGLSRSSAPFAPAIEQIHSVASRACTVSPAGRFQTLDAFYDAWHHANR